MSRPSSPSSKRTPKRVAGRTSVVSQVPRETLDVRPSWLEPEAAGPPPLEGAAEGRPTLDVRPSWLDSTDEEAGDAGGAADDEKERASTAANADTKAKAKAAAKTRAAPKKASRNMRPSVDPGWVEPAPPSERERRAIPPPLPPMDQPPSSRRAKKGS